MAQEIRKIPLSELVLWGENPRELIGDLRGRTRGKANQDIADRAFGSNSEDSLSWKMESLCRQMAKEDEYHLNELPTVCYEDEQPVVYDGNKRVLVGMLVHGIVTSPEPKYEVYKEKINFPYELDCNVCDRETALKIVNRMHADNRTWGTLEREIFKYEYRKYIDKGTKSKSVFLIIEEATGIISQHDELNQLFVKREIFTLKNLHELGFFINEEKLVHWHNSDADALKILENIIEIIRDKQVTTRRNRNQAVSILKEKREIGPILKKIEEGSKTRGETRPFEINRIERKRLKEVKKRTPRTESEEPILFGEELELSPGDTNDLYIDVVDLYQYFRNNPAKYKNPIIFIRAGMRLLCETAWGSKDEDAKNNWKSYINNKENFNEAKNSLDHDKQSLLDSYSINTSNNLVKALDKGAHNYSDSKNKDKAIAISYILGKLLKIWDGKNKNEE